MPSPIHLPCPTTHSLRRALQVPTTALLALGATSSLATAQTFRGLGFPAGTAESAARALSADGTVVVGDAGPAFAGFGFRWTQAGGMQGLGTLPGGTYAFAPSVSGDGSVVTGYGDSPGGQIAYRWTSATGIVGLASPPGATQVLGSDLDDHGAVIVGTVNTPSGYRAFRWTNAGGFVTLGTLPGGAISLGYACNGDGSVVVGDSYSTIGDVAFRWTAAGGMQSLGALPGGTFSFGYSVSADGLVVVGDSDSSVGDVAYRWTAATGMVSLGTLPGGFSYMVSNAVSADGSVIVGSVLGSVSNDRAFLWTSGLGIVDLNLYLPTLGINLAGWILTDAGGVSADGLTVAGTGLHNGVSEAWLATLPVPYLAFGQGCAGSAGVPTLQALGAPMLGSPFTVNVSHLPPQGGFLMLAFGLSDTTWNGSPLPLALASFGLPGCNALCSIDAVTLLQQSNGTASSQLAIPAQPSLSGLDFFQQALSFDAAAGNPLGGAVSNGGHGRLH